MSFPVFNIRMACSVADATRSNAFSDAVSRDIGAGMMDAAALIPCSCTFVNPSPRDPAMAITGIPFSLALWATPMGALL